MKFFKTSWSDSGPHTISSTPLPPFLSSLFWKQIEHLQHHLFILLSFGFHPRTFDYNFWYFLLSFPLQCCVYQPFNIPGKEEICKIFSPTHHPPVGLGSSPLSCFNPQFFSVIFPKGSRILKQKNTALKFGYLPMHYTGLFYVLKLQHQRK